MSLVEVVLRLAAYIVCVVLALEVSHRLYWQAKQRVLAMSASVAVTSCLCTLSALIPFAAAVGVTYAFATILDHGSLLALGIRHAANAASDLACGAGLALLCVTLVYLIGIISGLIEVRRSNPSEDYPTRLPLFLSGLMDFLTASVFEEMMFRGYVFFVLYKAGGACLAVVGSSVVFTAAHLIKQPKLPLIYIVNGFVFGLLLALCRLHTGTIWMPVGIHLGWNLISGPIFGLPCAGRNYERGIAASTVSGPAWLTGGLYSLDAGALGTLALFAAAGGLAGLAPI